MIDLNLLIVFDGEKLHLADIKPSDLVALERHFAVALPRLTSFSFEQCCFLVWRRLRRDGRIGEGVGFDDDFLDRIESLEQADVPFVGPTDGPSPTSLP